MADTTKIIKRPDQTPDDVINDVLEENDFELNEDEARFMDWRFFKNRGHNYANEGAGTNFPYFTHTNLTRKLLRRYFREKGMPIVEVRGWVGSHMYRGNKK